MSIKPQFCLLIITSVLSICPDIVLLFLNFYISINTGNKPYTLKPYYIYLKYSGKTHFKFIYLNYKLSNILEYNGLSASGIFNASIACYFVQPMLSIKFLIAVISPSLIPWLIPSLFLFPLYLY